jgi:glycosyltransferase involved in cell wall biosynthesis
MKKVLIYNGQLFMGGIERILISYLNTLAKEEEIEITLLIKENDPEKNVFYKDIPEGIKCIFIKSEEAQKFRYKIAAKRKNPLYRLFYQGIIAYERFKMKNWLENFFEKNSYDWVIDFDMSLGKYLDVIPFPKIGWCHYSLAAKKGKKRERFAKRMEQYDKVVVICDEMKKELKEVYPQVADRGTRIYNPMNIESVREKAEDLSEFTPEDKKLLETPYMVAVSRLVKGKGREDLIEIYFEMKKNGIKEKLYILGEGEERENLQRRIDKLNLQEEVKLLGQKKNPYPWMKKAELFLHTSYGEGLPTVFIESMICGTPVAAYDCPTGPAEILGNGKYGILTPMGEQERIREEIEKYLGSTPEREKYLNILEAKIEEFDSNSIKKQFKELIEVNRG